MKGQCKRPQVGHGQTEKLGIAILSQLVNEPRETGGLGFLFRELTTSDYGIDGQIEVVEGIGEQAEPTGKIVSVQVKSGSSFLKPKTGDSWVISIRQTTVEYWRSHSVPVLLVVVDVEGRTCYWARGDTYEHEETEEHFKVRVPKCNILDNRSARRVTELADEPTEVERRLAALEITGDVEEQIAPDSDLLSKDFASYFANRLRIYHAANTEKFNKKAFEYAFVAAARYAGNSAIILPSTVAPNADVEIDNHRYSLKTEAVRNLSRTAICISKFSEARWIRDCETPEDLTREATRRVPEHLRCYERVFTLRAFDMHAVLLGDELPAVRYELWEIPRSLLMHVENLRPEDFAPKSTAVSSCANVMLDDGTRAFRLALDGSVEKVTLAGIRTDLCRFHGAWTISMMVAEEERPAYQRIWKS